MKTYDAFISYATEDLSVATQVQLVLARELRCFLAPATIRPGAEFIGQLASAISDSRSLVVLLSSAATVSPWVQSEVFLAVHYGLTVLPVIIRRDWVSAALEPWWTFMTGRYQRLDATTLSLESTLDRILDTMRSETAAPEPPAREAEAFGLTFRSWGSDQPGQSCLIATELLSVRLYDAIVGDEAPAPGSDTDQIQTNLTPADGQAFLRRLNHASAAADFVFDLPTRPQLERTVRAVRPLLPPRATRATPLTRARFPQDASGFRGLVGAVRQCCYDATASGFAAFGGTLETPAEHYRDGIPCVRIGPDYADPLLGFRLVAHPRSKGIEVPGPLQPVFGRST